MGMPNMILLVPGIRAWGSRKARAQFLTWITVAGPFWSCTRFLEALAGCQYVTPAAGAIVKGSLVRQGPIGVAGARGNAGESPGLSRSGEW